jgi:transcription elongation GreA/GreB family factor
MSKAFTTESGESVPPPERMIDDGPNPVTSEGFAQIEAHVARLEAALKTEANVLLRETLARDLRYWTVRKSTAEVVQPATDGTVGFGSRVTISRKGREQTFRIVGVDEADASKGLISIHAPLAAAIIGARVGDIVEAAEPLGEIEVLNISATINAHRQGGAFSSIHSRLLI